MKKLIYLFAAALFCTPQIHSQMQTVVATPANDFLNSIGVNSSINSRGEQVDSTLKTCLYIGARWIRSGPPDSGADQWKQNTIACFQKLYNQGGIRFSLMLPSSGDAYTDSSSGVNYPDGITYLMDGAKQIVNQVSPDALLAFEGVNEPNNWAITYQGQSSGQGNSWRGLARYHRDMYNAIQADPVLKNYPVWSLSETGAELDNMGLQFITVPANATAVDAEFRGVTFADYANCHNYFVHPTWPIHSNNQTWLVADPTKNAKADDLYGSFGLTWYKGFTGHTDAELLTIPRVTTETGVTITQPYLWDWNTNTWTTTPDPDYSNPATRITEEDQALTYLSCYLAQFKQGWSYTAMYILRDRIDEGGNQTFGFYESHWVNETIRYPSNPRLAARYMHNMTTILADNQSIAAPESLAYGINPCPETVHDLLLQKNDGKMMLVIWDEKYASGATAEDVTVQFDKTYSTIKIYNPAQYNPAQPEQGTQPVQTVTGANQVTLSMLNHPYILELVPSQGTGIKAVQAKSDACSITTAPGAIVLSNDGSAADYAIYNRAGQMVAKGALTKGKKTIMLPDGVYVVKAADMKQKVVVQ